MYQNFNPNLDGIIRDPPKNPQKRVHEECQVTVKQRIQINLGIYLPSLKEESPILSKLTMSNDVVQEEYG